MICNDSMDVHVYVYIIIYNLVYRKGKKVLPGAKSQFLYIGMNNLELLLKYLLCKRVLTKDKDLITLLNRVSIHTSVIWQMKDMKLSLDQEKNVLNYSIPWWVVRCNINCDVCFFPECVYFCQLKICTKSPPGLVVRTSCFHGHGPTLHTWTGN